MQNRMGLSSTAKKLFVWRLRLNVQNAQPLQSWNWVVNTKKLLTNTNIWGFYWILSSQMTKTFRDNCDINIVQQTSCEPLFPVVQMLLKTYFFVPFLRPCMHLNYGVISGSHACRDCWWHIILVAELYATCPGERALVAIRFNVTFLPLRLCYVNTSTCLLFLERCRKSNNAWLRALMQSDCFYSSLFFEHYIRISLCEWVIELCSVRLIEGMTSHNAFVFYLD